MLNKVALVGYTLCESIKELTEVLMVKRKKIVVFVVLLVILLGSPLFGGGHKEVPGLNLATSGTQYISPNDDDIQDEAELSFSITVHVKSDEGYVPEYGMQILDPAGTQVKQIVETEKSDVGWFARIFRGYETFTLEKTISWDGFDESGNLVADGTYHVKVWVVDSVGHRKDIPVDDFIVDTVPPTLSTPVASSSIFSPNDDGVLDSLTITQTGGSVEHLWEGGFYDDSGELVRAYTWTDSTPAEIVWDGLDDDGNKAFDGTYSYKIKATDLAGNASEEYVIEGIVMNAGTSEIAFDIEYLYISPNDDEVQDQTTIGIKFEMTEGLISWSGSLTTMDGSLLWQEQGETSAPEGLTFYGIGPDGVLLPDGKYRMAFSATYENGNRPVIEEWIVIDTVPPVITILVDNPEFSPNADGNKDWVEIQLNSNEPVTWVGRILNSRGEVIIETDSTKTTSLIAWNGRGALGNKLPDGKYRLEATFADLAGNRVIHEPVELVINAYPVAMTVIVPIGFSPNDDGVEDTLLVTIKTDKRAQVVSWDLEVRDPEGVIVRSVSSDEPLPEELFWDGKDDSGANAPEDHYTLFLTAEMEEGKIVEVESQPTILDITPPEVIVSVTKSPFVITDEGVAGEVFIALKVLNEQKVTEWTMDILSDDGEILRSYSGKGDPTDQIVWRGYSDGDGAEEIIEEEVTLRIQVVDAGGNRTTYKEDITLDILVVLRDGKFFIMVPNIIFSAYQDRIDTVSAHFHSRNLKSLEKVKEVLDRYPGYILGLEAHALNIYEGMPEKYMKEEEILFPLTERRAQAVMNALVEMGIDPDQVVVKAYGGVNPITSVFDRSIRWKNRRVEFILLRSE